MKGKKFLAEFVFDEKTPFKIDFSEHGFKTPGEPDKSGKLWR